MWRTLSGFLLLLVLLQPVSADPLWSRTAAGAFPGRPAVTNGLVLAPSDDRHLYAYELETGTLVWRAYLAERPTGAIAVSPDGTILLGTRRRELAAVNLRGRVIWRNALKAVLSGDPAIDSDGTIYVSITDGTLLAYSHQGRQRFSVDTGNDGGSCSPVILPDGAVAVGGVDRTVRVFDALGELRWRAVLAGVPTGMAVSESGLYVSTDFGSIVALSFSGEIRWDELSEDPYLPPVIHDGSVVTVSARGIVSLLDPDGAIVWSHDIGETPIHAPIVDHRGTVLVETQAGTLTRVGPEGVISPGGEFVPGSQGMILSSDGLLIAGSDSWRISAFDAGTLPGVGWTQRGVDERHAGSASGNFGPVDKTDRDSQQLFLESLASQGGRELLLRALEEVEGVIASSDAMIPYRYLRGFLEELAGEGLLRVERTIGRVGNDFPDIRSKAMALLPAVAGIGTNRVIAGLLRYEYDANVQITALRAAGQIGSDPGGDVTRAASAIVAADIAPPGGLQPRVAEAAIACVSGIIAYHGEPMDESGLTMLLEIFRANYPRETRESALDAIRSIRYY